MYKKRYMNKMNARRKLCQKVEIEYSQKNNISINILNDDCLKHVFTFLPIADKLRVEKGKYSILYIYIYIYSVFHMLLKINVTFFHVYIYIYIYFYCYSLHTLENSE